MGLDTIKGTTGTFVDVLVTGTSGTSLNVSGNALIGGNLTASTLVVTGTTSLLGSVSVGPASQFVSYASASTTTTATMFLDRFNFNVYRTAEYLVQIVDSTTSNPQKVQIEKFLLFHNGGTPLPTPYLISYGIGFNFSELGSWDAIATGTDIVLQFSPTIAPTGTGTIIVKTVRTSIML